MCMSRTLRMLLGRSAEHLMAPQGNKPCFKADMQVRTSGLLRGIRIMARKGVKNLSVFDEYVAHSSINFICTDRKAINDGHQIVHDLHQYGVVGYFEDSCMEAAVELRKVLWITEFLLHPLDDCRELKDLMRSNPPRRETQTEALQFFADRIDMEDLRRRDGGNDVATWFRFFHQVLGMKATERLSYRGPAYPELLRD